jgi:hypothetical protein
MLKSNFIKELLLDSSIFSEYTIVDGERLTTVAFDFYGSVDYTWLVVLSNQIIDPYFEWPLSQQELELYIAKKYGSLQEARSTIVEYRLIGTEKIISIDTYNNIWSDIEFPEDFIEPIYAYDKEFNLNETKRFVRLIKPELAPTIQLELEKSLKG